MSGTAPSHITAITIDNPPVNALSRTVVDTLTAQVAEANADPAVTAIVIIGKGRGFIAGADINNFLRVIEHGDPMIELSPMLAVIENCAKPVIAAIMDTRWAADWRQPWRVTIASRFPTQRWASRK